MSSSKEAFLERKIECLERRLTRIEKFVEIRFSASLEDPSPKPTTEKTRYISTDPDFGDDELALDNSSTTSTSPQKKRSTKLKGRKPGPLNPRGRPKSSRNATQTDVAERHKSLINECFVRIVQSTPLRSKAKTTAESTKKEAPIASSSSSNPYGTRRQKRIEAEAASSSISIAEVKQEVEEECVYDDDAANNWNRDDNDDHSSLTESTLDPKSKPFNNFDPIDHEVEVNTDDYRDEGGEYFVFRPENGESGGNVSGDPDFEVCKGSSAGASRNKRRPKGRSTSATEASKSKKYKLTKDSNSTSTTTPKKKRPNYNYRFGSISMKSLSQPKVISTDPDRGECPVCHIHLIHELLPSHIATHARERTIHCPHCDKSFWKEQTLRKHVLTIHDKDNYKRRCRQCGKPIIGNLLHHEQFCIRRALEKDQEVDPELIEDIRKRLLRLGRELELPDKSKQVDPNERKTCPTCKKTFSMLYYDRHVKSHDKARNWKCSKCPKAYINKHDLIRHMILTHENIPTCQVCKLTFDSRAELYMHSLKVCMKRNVGESKPVNWIEENVEEDANSKSKKGQPKTTTPGETPSGDIRNEEGSAAESSTQAIGENSEETCSLSNELTVASEEIVT